LVQAIGSTGEAVSNLTMVTALDADYIRGFSGKARFLRKKAEQRI
jgi:hypothetical protein